MTDAVTDTALVSAIIGAPDDDAPRLAYADWLVRRGDPRGALIRVQCELAHLSATDPRAAELVARERGLLDRHARRWLGVWDVPGVAYQFRRGFLDALAIAPAVFAAHAPRAAAAHAAELIHLRSLDLRWAPDAPEPGPHDFETIVTLAALARLERLELGHRVTAADVRALARSPHLARLRALIVEDGDGAPLVAELVRARYLDRLETLALRTCQLTDDAAVALAAWPRLAQLRALDLSSIDISDDWCNTLGDRGAIALATAARSVTDLDLSANPAIGDPTAAAIAAAPHLANLTRLRLELTRTTDAGARALATLSRLEHLDLGFTMIGDAALPALLAMPRLTALPLSGTHVTLAGIERLLEPSCHLVEVDLRFEELAIPDELERALIARFPNVSFVVR